MSDNKIAKIFVMILGSIIMLCCIIFRNEINNISDIEVQFSAKGGFYDEPFYLVLDTKADATIYYTIDGSEPNRNSRIYNEPIYIIDATINDNVYSMHEDVSSGFLLDYINEFVPGTEPGYAVPDYNVEKCTVIRAVAYDDEGQKGKETVECYFVDFQNKKGFDNVYTVCINADPNDLFGYENGIYVLGKTFEEYYNSEQWNIDKVERVDSWENWLGNYSNKNDIEASITIFNESDEFLLSSNCNVCIKGNTSITYNQKSLSIDLLNSEFDFFNDGIVSRSFALEAGGQDGLINLRDKLVNDLCSNTNVITRDYIPCVMFLNGEYWGYYYISQKVNEDYFSNYYGIDKKELIVIKNGQLKYGVEEDYLLYTELSSFVESHDMSISQNYYEFCQLVDINSLMEYYAIEIIICNQDWGDCTNNSMWRSRSASEYGTWRWFLFDVNTLSMQTNLLVNDKIEQTKDDSIIFGELSKNQEFASEFKMVMQRIRNENLNSERVLRYIDSYEADHLDNLLTNARRFYGNARRDDIENELDDIRRFFIER